MCGRYTSRTGVAEIADALGVEEVLAPDLGARFNVAPTDEVYAVASPAGARRLGTLRWGLVPPWAPDPSVGSRMINARAETVATTPAFRRALRDRRCLVPADGFYEWVAVEGRPRKQAWHIRRRDGLPFAFAGLWEVWRPPGPQPDAAGERLSTCTIVTTEANATVAPLHDRMPVILPPETWDAWLDPDNRDVEALQRLLVPAPDDLLEAVPVSPLVGDVRNDGPELLEPVDLDVPPDEPAPAAQQELRLPL